MITKNFLAVVAGIIMCLSAIPYIIDILRKQTKPHAFSWLVWTLLMSTAFAAQFVSGAGPGAWVTLVNAMLVLVIFLLSLRFGERQFDHFDWLCLAGALLAMGLWWLTSNPTAAVILVTVTDAVGFIPTFRKGFRKPFEETLSLYAFGAVGLALSLFALDAYSLTTWLYPASLVVTNSCFILLVLAQRKRR